MCGIVGWLGHGEDMRASGERALALLAHRGPDASRLWIGPGGVALGNARLAVLDTRHAADQPMARDGNRITHNGEIYNYIELRDELAALGERFTTSSDTEVVLAAYARWGASAVARFEGMFAFALWDERSRAVLLARDRFGEKPLFAVRGPGCFHFASEIKALFAFACVSRAPDTTVVRRFAALGEMPDGGERTFFAGIARIAPATSLLIHRPAETPTPTTYWQLRPDRDASRLRMNAATDRLRDLLDESVRIRLRSDVALGVTLSGGIDSSAIVLALARLGEVPRTFTLRIEGSDEWPRTEEIRSLLRLEANSATLAPSDVIGLVDRVLWHQDEPMAHTTAMAQWRVYELARAVGVTVLLEGHGADELFAGYQPGAVGAALASALRRGALANAQRILLQRVLTGREVGSLLMASVAAGVPAGWRETMRLLRWRTGSLLGAADRTGMPPADCVDARDPLRHWVCSALGRSSLPALLRYSDRSSMAHSVEVRSPFLDARIASFAAGLIPEHLVDGLWTKRVLRQVVRTDLPRLAGRRDKTGFTAPETEWLRGPLRVWGDQLVASLGQRDLFSAGSVGGVWNDVIMGRAPAQVGWRLAVVELWARRFLDGPLAPP